MALKQTTKLVHKAIQYLPHTIKIPNKVKSQLGENKRTNLAKLVRHARSTKGGRTKLRQLVHSQPARQAMIEQRSRRYN